MNTEQLRAEFEVWANGRCELYLVNPAGRYSSATTQFAWEAYQAGRAALQSQDREDALRYRWLRQQRTISDQACVTWNIGHDWIQMDGAELDAAIDHARRAEGEASDSE